MCSCGKNVFMSGHPGSGIPHNKPDIRHQTIEKNKALLFIRLAFTHIIQIKYNSLA